MQTVVRWKSKVVTALYFLTALQVEQSHGERRVRYHALTHHHTAPAEKLSKGHLPRGAPPSAAKNAHVITKDITWDRRQTPCASLNTKGAAIFYATADGAC